MPALPDGDPAPGDGALPSHALDSFRGGGTFGYYVHVPFCYKRCGYCDFNTYVPAAGAEGLRVMERTLRATVAEIELSARVLGADGGALRPVDSVFFGGGTPTMMRPGELVLMLRAIQQRFGLTPGAEVTVEANPDTVSPEAFEQLAAGGFTRVSIGMQSAVPHVLSTLGRTHTPENVERAVEGARAAGLVTSVDLIYGTPGESLADWESTVREAVRLNPEHISAYALVVEEGTGMAASVARGEIVAPDGDDEADKYELTDSLLSAAGFRWYEVSNWARTPLGRGRHNEGYWHDGHWWGAGAGAHSHIGGVRWWNKKYPATYSAALEAGNSPAAGRETPDAQARFTEKVMLGIRLAEGLPLQVLENRFAVGRQAVPQLVKDGLLEASPLVEAEPRLVLTLRGRLLADAVVRTLLGF